MEFYIRAIFNISFRKYFHIDNKDVKFPFDDHCFSLMIQYKFEFSLPWREAGGTDTLRTEDSSLSREFVTPWHSLLTQFPVKSEAPSSRAPPMPLPLFAICQPWHRQTVAMSSRDWQRLLWIFLSEVCLVFQLWFQEMEKHKNVINYWAPRKCGWLFCF